MQLRVVGAGVGRTGTHSLKLALEQLLGAPCHHMMEIIEDPTRAAGWVDAIDGKPDWDATLAPYAAVVDWPGGAFWRELSDHYPDSLVLLSVREPEDWYRSAINTIFLTLQGPPPGGGPGPQLPPGMAEWLQRFSGMMADRFCVEFDNPQKMMDAFVRHNDAVRAGVPASRLLEWRPGDGWEPICDRLGLPVPAEPFPKVNSTDEFRAMLGMPAL